MAFSNLLDPVFDPLLNLHPALAIFAVAFVITFLVTLVYKFTTDQTKMKKLKEDMKESQKKIKELSKTDPEKAMKMQGDAMQHNLEYMKQSFKSTLYTLIPVLIIFAWMSANLAFHPIAPGQQFTVTAEFANGHLPNVSLTSVPDLEFINGMWQDITYDEKTETNVAVWQVKAPSEGEYQLNLVYNNELYDHRILITDGKKYFAPEKVITESKLKKITVGNEKIYPFSILGLRFTWFWAYVVISILLSLLIRKIMKVY